MVKKGGDTANKQANESGRSRGGLVSGLRRLARSGGLRLEALKRHNTAAPFLDALRLHGAKSELVRSAAQLRRLENQQNKLSEKGKEAQKESTALQEKIDALRGKLEKTAGRVARLSAIQDKRREDAAKTKIYDREVYNEKRNMRKATKKLVYDKDLTSAEFAQAKENAKKEFKSKKHDLADKSLSINKERVAVLAQDLLAKYGTAEHQEAIAARSAVQAERAKQAAAEAAEKLSEAVKSQEQERLNKPVDIKKLNLEQLQQLYDTRMNEVGHKFTLAHKTKRGEYVEHKRSADADLQKGWAPTVASMEEKDGVRRLAYLKQYVKNAYRTSTDPEERSALSHLEAILKGRQKPETFIEREAAQKLKNTTKSKEGPSM